MPHITIEHSANLSDRADIQELCNALHAAALETGHFELGAVRVRAVRCDHYAVADRLPENAFTHIMLRIGVGRSQDDKKAMGETIWAAALDALSPAFATPHFALTFEIIEIDGAYSWKKNAIHPRIRGAEKK